jgi:hypothetical protein
MSINVRRKGKTFELKMAKVWMRLFGGEVERSSFVNKKLDDQGVDLIGTDPFSIQCKAVERSLDVHTILQNMPQNSNINVVVHKRNHQAPVACLSLEDFLDLVQMLKKNQIL